MLFSGFPLASVFIAVIVVIAALTCEQVCRPVTLVTVAVQEVVTSLARFSVFLIVANITFAIGAIQGATTVALAISKLTLKAIAIGKVIGARTILGISAEAALVAIPVVKI